MKRQKIGFIGGGNMASSLIGGLVSNGYPVDKITVLDLDAKKLAYFFTVERRSERSERPSGQLVPRASLSVLYMSHLTQD